MAPLLHLDQQSEALEQIAGFETRRRRRRPAPAPPVAHNCRRTAPVSDGELLRGVMQDARSRPRSPCIAASSTRRDSAAIARARIVAGIEEMQRIVGVLRRRSLGGARREGRSTVPSLPRIAARRAGPGARCRIRRLRRRRCSPSRRRAPCARRVASEHDRAGAGDGRRCPALRRSRRRARSGRRA